MRDTQDTSHPLFVLVAFAFLAVFMLGLVYLTPTAMEQAAEHTLRATVIDVMPELKPTLTETAHPGPVTFSHRWVDAISVERTGPTCSADQPGVVEGGVNLETNAVDPACVDPDDEFVD